jgi:hypothetical protein
VADALFAGDLPAPRHRLITAAGGAWNASIVAEYVHYGGRTLVAPGLGSLITQASESANFALLAAGVLTMSLASAGPKRTIQPRSPADFLRLATYCISRQLPLLHADADFEPMVRDLGLRLPDGVARA